MARWRVCKTHSASVFATIGVAGLGGGATATGRGGVAGLGGRVAAGLGLLEEVEEENDGTREVELPGIIVPTAPSTSRCC